MSAKESIQNRYRFRWSFLYPKYWLTWFGVSVLFVFSLLPMPVIDWIGCRLGSIASHLNKKRFNIIRTNLSLCFPNLDSNEVESMVKKNFQAQFRSLLHYCVLWWHPVSSVKNKIQKNGFEKIEQYRKQGKQVIILLIHNVGLEFAVAGISMDDAMNGPYKSMKNPIINWLIVNGRVRFGQANGIKIFTRDDGMRPLIRETKKGKVLVYLADEDLGADRSVFAPFYGVTKATIPVLGRLAKACDAVVLPCACCYQSATGKYEVKLFSEIKGLPSSDDKQDSLLMNEAIEQAINYCPIEYLWSLRYFKTRPPGEPSVYE